MKKTVLSIIKVIVIIIAVFFVLGMIALGIFDYTVNYIVRDVDSCSSPDGEYTLELKSKGEALLFGSANGILVLKKGKDEINKTSFSLYDDGGQVRPGIWHVTWGDDFAEVVICGSEQKDEQIRLYYNGENERKTLDTIYGKNPEYALNAQPGDEGAGASAGAKASDAESELDEDGYPNTPEYKAYKKELLTIAELIRGENGGKIDYYTTAKGTPYIVVSAEVEEETGKITELQLILNESFFDDGKQEYVLEKVVYGAGVVASNSPEIVDFYLIDKETLEVTDEETDAWH